MKINTSDHCEICKGFLTTRFVKLETFIGSDLLHGEMQVEQNNPIYIHVYCLSDLETQIRNLNNDLEKTSENLGRLESAVDKISWNI